MTHVILLKDIAKRVCYVAGLNDIAHNVNENIALVFSVIAVTTNPFVFFLLLFKCQ